MYLNHTRVLPKDQKSSNHRCVRLYRHSLSPSTIRLSPSLFPFKFLVCILKVFRVVRL